MCFRNLEWALNTRCSRQCVGALTLCLTELPSDTVLRNLPSLLIHLSQLSSTVYMATATLELLAVLAQLKHLYTNFVDDQYMSVFAVSLNYTNPLKFSRYVVSLAHYVILTWFVNCRLSMRAEFVKFINRTLHITHSNTMSKEVEQIRNDLMETCVDVFARYAFSDCSNPPQRPPLAQFLFDQGPSCTWLLGNRLITITTSAKLTPKKISQMHEHVKNNKPTSFWPKPSSKQQAPFSSNLTPTFQRQIPSEAPAKLQTFSEVSAPSGRLRHKSGGAVLRRHTNTK